MIIERFKNQDPIPVYRRVRERGRSLPDGLKYMVLSRIFRTFDQAAAPDCGTCG